MFTAGSLQLFHELGTCKKYGAGRHHGQVKRHVMKTSRLHLLKLHLFSHALQDDSWTLHLTDIVHRPTHCCPSRNNVFICRSFLTPLRPNDTPVLKAAASALTRSYKYLHGSPLVIQMVPAAGIVAFSLWGLGPLMRLCRNLLLHQSDGSWKNSSTYYIFASYLQPLLLWTGLTLICRALDPVTLPSVASQVVKKRILTFVRSLSTVLSFAHCISSLMQHAQKFFMETNDSSNARNMGFQFAGKALYTAVWIAAASLFMELLGFSTQRWITAGGLGTVLLTLAGREIFTNFLSSVMIHATRPFIVNEWIQTKIDGCEVSGMVEHVGWWSPTIIRGDDREAVHVPNHKFTVNVVRNLSQKTHWRIKTHLAISHLDVNKMHNIVADMRKVLAKNPHVEQQRLHRRVFLEDIDPENQALLILVSCFVKTPHVEEYLCVKEGILLDLLRVISHHHARLATPIRTIHKMYADTDVKNMNFGETIFNHSKPTTHRPLLLIEPPSRINGEDKSKAHTMRENEDQDIGEPVTQDSKATSSVSDIASHNGSSGELFKETNPGDVPAEQGVTEGEPSTVPPSTSTKPLEDLDYMGRKMGASPAASPVKHENERPPAAPPLIASLEDNIVLGVALEGSKRTLPIEEGMGANLNPLEGKEVAIHRNRNGSKDKKENEGLAVGRPEGLSGEVSK